jgi:hypothetical protein
MLIVIPAVALSVGGWAAEDGRFERSLEVGPSVDLQVETDSGRITVRPGPQNSVRVVGTIKIQPRWIVSASKETVAKIESNPPIEQHGDTIRIGEMLRAHDTKGLTISYEITVPPETRLRSKCDSGGQSIEGINGPVDAECDSGGLRFADIRGDVKAECDSGRIEADGIDGSFTASADSGGIHVSGIAGKVDVSTDSGGIEIEQTSPADIIASADSGGVRVTIPPDAGYDLKAESDSGGVDVKAPLTVSGTIKRDRIQGKINGGGHVMELATDSGGIRINQGRGEL